MNLTMDIGRLYFHIDKIVSSLRREWGIKPGPRTTRSQRLRAMSCDATKIFRRSLRLPYMAPWRLRQLLALEAETLCPFPLGNGMLLHRVIDKDFSRNELGIELLAIPEAIGEELLREAAKTPFQPIILVDDGGGTLSWPLSLMPHGLWLERAKTLLPISAYAAAVAVVTTCALYPLMRQQNELAAIRAQMQSVSPAAARASTLRGEIEAIGDALRAIGEKKSQALRVGALLADVSDLLPKSASLLSLKLEGSDLLLDGRAADANAILPPLEKVPGVMAAGFSAPIYQDASAGGQSFSIKAKINRLEKTP